MGKTADLTVVQKTTIDTLHKEGKTQKFMAKEAGCSQSSVSKHINREFPQSVMVWGAMSSVGVGPLCFLRSKVNTAVYQ